ncbi:MAG: universal stress protein [Salinigranum sp.]
MYQNILVPTDGSEYAEAALDHAISLAQQFDSTIHVLHVVDERLTGLVTEYQDLGTEVQAEMEDDLEAMGRDATETAIGRAEEADVPAESHVVAGVPARAIVEFADDNDVDVVVMGTHGRSGFGRALLGSVTEKVVRSADVPVITVRGE